MIAEPIATPAPRQPWPMTSEAWQALADDVEAVTAQVERFETVEPPDPAGLIDPSLSHAARRLVTLRAVYSTAECVDDESVIVIGRRATLREDDGTIVEYAIVFPGDGDPTMGWVSGDSPLGAALLGARKGDLVDVHAPAGRRTVEVVDVA